MAGEATHIVLLYKNYYSLHTCNLQQSILPSSVRQLWKSVYLPHPGNKVWFREYGGNPLVMTWQLN
jgi:hypothetical protein